MSVVSAIFNRSADNYRDIFHATDITSDAMKAAIGEWYRLYYQQEATEKEDPCQQIPHTIVRKLTKTAFAEYKATGADEFAQGVLDALDKKKNGALQKALIGGKSLLKPVPTKDGFRFTVVDRSNILVFGRDEAGHVTDIGTSQTTVRDAFYYTLLERRMVDANGYLTIRNYLCRSTTAGTIGQLVNLQSVPEYAALPDVYTFPQPVGSVGLAMLRTPLENCVDGGPDAVSVYAAAVGLIRNININEAQLNGEFERGESRIIVSEDMLTKRKDGKRVFRDHTFTGVDGDPESIGVTIFSPALREQSFLARKTEYLRNIESIIGLKRGLLSEVEAAERTAKEITSSEGDYNLTIIDFQNAWEDAVREACRICGILGQMYHIPSAHEISEDDISFDWGNGVLYDEEATWADMKDQVARGLLKPEIAMGWRYGMPYETEADLKKIRQKYMPAAAEDGDV